jgi:hypothetical protein
MHLAQCLIENEHVANICLYCCYGLLSWEVGKGWNSKISSTHYTRRSLAFSQKQFVVMNEHINIWLLQLFPLGTATC